MNVKTRIVQYICRTCGRKWDAKPTRFNPHIDKNMLDTRGTMPDCEKPKVVKVVYIAKEIIPQN